MEEERPTGSSQGQLERERDEVARACTILVLLSRHERTCSDVGERDGGRENKRTAKLRHRASRIARFWSKDERQRHCRLDSRLRQGRRLELPQVAALALTLALPVTAADKIPPLLLI